MTSKGFDIIENNNSVQYRNSLYAIVKNDSNENKYVLNYCGAVFVSEFIAEFLAEINGISEFICNIKVEDLPKITRGEFIKQLLEISGEKTSMINSDDYMEAAENMVIIFGNGDGDLYPEENINIEDACVIADRLLQSRGIVLNKDEEAKPFILKLDGVNDYAMDSVCRFYSVVGNGIIVKYLYDLLSIYGIYDIVYYELNDISY